MTPLFRRPVSVRVTGWPIVASSWPGLPYMPPSPPGLDMKAQASDEWGVYQHVVAGRRYDHPVVQAQLVTNMLAGFRLTSDLRYLERARANCQRLVDTAIARRGALYLPFRFPHPIARAVMAPTWYSAMAQGLALSALCRMHYVTADTAWLDAAHRIFASFVRQPLPGRPWTVRRDRCGHLWLEEYPKPVRCPPMRVLNGHIFAAIGVYDYLWLTGQPSAALIFDAALTTIRDHGHEYRIAGACSRYSLTRPVAKPAYHPTHVWQLARLAAWTGDEWFRELSELLSNDFTPGA